MIVIGTKSIGGMLRHALPVMLNITSTGRGVKLGCNTLMMEPADMREAVSGYCPKCLNGYASNWEVQRCLDSHKEKPNVVKDSLMDYLTQQLDFEVKQADAMDDQWQATIHDHASELLKIIIQKYKEEKLDV